MAFYQRIRDLREDADKTQQEIADYLGTSAQHYGKYESGKAEIPFERAVLLAEYYNVSLDYIAGATNVKRIQSQPQEKAELDVFSEKIGSMPPPVKDELKEILQIVLKILN